MRYVAFIMLYACLAGCMSTGQERMKNESGSAEHSAKAAIINDVEQAIAEKEYRLWASAGRQVRVPGIAIEHQEHAMKVCGYRFMPAMTDVIRNDKERAERAAKHEYMATYNQYMLKHCQK